MAENKVVYGLKNVHYAVITEDAGAVTYGTPVALPGAVNMTLEPRGELSEFYADDIVYFSSSPNQGYDGTLEIANITEAFRTDVLGETLSATSKVLSESSTAKPKKIALMFEFDGDVKAVRHLLTYCTVSRPGASSSTKTETIEPTTQEITLVASSRPSDSVIKYSTTAETTTSVYDTWYDAVFEGDA